MPKILESPKESIIEHAKRIIMRDGYNSFTMRKISEESGIAIGTIYNYFPNKKDLTVELMMDYWQEYLYFVQKVDNDEKDFYKKLYLIYEELIEFIATFLDVWIKDSTDEYTKEDMEKRKAFTEKFVSILEVILRRAEAEGQISIPTNYHDTANFLVLNIIMLAQMKLFQYENFEKIIRKLFT